MVVEQKSKQNMQLIISVILIAVVFGSVAWLVLPQKDALDSAEASFEESQETLDKKKRELNQLTQLESTFEEGEVRRKTILNLIPESIEQNLLMNQIVDLADENRVSLNTIGFAQSYSSEYGVNTLNISTSVVGTHKNLKDFIKSIENSSRKMKINSISVQRLENRLENMTLTIEAYYL